MLLASAAVQEGMSAPVMHLRNLNPHVAAALKDWARHGGPDAAVPRQPSGAANSLDLDFLPHDNHAEPPSSCWKRSSAYVHPGWAVHAGALHGGLNTSQLAGTSSFGMSGVNAHMLLAPPLDTGHLPAQLAADMPWERARLYPLPRAHHLVARFSRPGRDTCAFSFCLGAQTAHLAQNLVCGQLLMPACALLEAVCGAMCTLDEQLARAVLVRVVLPEQAPLPAQPTAVTFTGSFSTTAGVTVRFEGDRNKPRSGILLQAWPLAVKNVAQQAVMAAGTVRSAPLANLTRRTSSSLSETATEASSIAARGSHGASCDGYLCMPGASAAALDLLTNGCSGPEQLLAPTVLLSAEAFLVSADSYRNSRAWVLAGGMQKARLCSAGLAGDLGELTACFEMVSFQVAKRAKQDIMEAAASLVYDVEWQTASPQDCSPISSGGFPSFSDAISQLFCKTNESAVSVQVCMCRRG